jgi:G3E family GTPase
VTSRTPVSIITGFLGSGKTTLLNHVLADPRMAGAAVIINEFGEIGLDHLLIATPNENTVLLSSGCICCTVRGDLVDTLRDLDAKRAAGGIPPFDRVLIETTGLADPVPIIQTVITDEKIAPQFELDSVVTLVDAVNGMTQLDRQPEAVKQAAIADRLFMTKTDIADAHSTTLLEERLSRLNPGVPMQDVRRGVIAPERLFGAALKPRALGADVARWLQDDAVARAAHATAKAHDDHIQAFCITLDAPVSRMGMTAWLTALASLRGAQLLRVKALLNVEGAPVAVHAVQTLIHEPVALARWPNEDRRSRLVFITRAMARDDIEATLDVLHLQPSPAGKLDPRAYAQFVAAMRKVH